MFVRKLLTVAGVSAALPVLVATAASASTSGPAWHKHQRCTPVLVRVHHHHHRDGGMFRLAADQMGLMRRADNNRREGDFRTVLVCRHARHEHHNRHCFQRGLGSNQLGGVQDNQQLGSLQRDPMHQCRPQCEHRMLSGTLRSGGPSETGQFCRPPCPPMLNRDSRVQLFPGNGNNMCQDPGHRRHHHGREHNPYPTHKPYPTPSVTHTHDPYPTPSVSYTPKTTDPTPYPSVSVTYPPKPDPTVTYPTVAPSTYAPAS